MLNEYEKSLNNSDAKLAQALFTKDGIFMPIEAPSGIGSEGILKSYGYLFSQIQLNIKFFIEEIQVEGNMAFAIVRAVSCHFWTTMKLLTFLQMFQVPFWLLLLRRMTTIS